jgi:CRISPR-associated protein Cmr2
MPHLLLISIGPVQTFIASAQRTSDLWSGSHIVNRLAKTAARTICAEADKNQLIMPHIGDDWKEALHASSHLAISNKIEAYILTAPDEMGEKIHQALHAELLELVAQLDTRITKAFTQMNVSNKQRIEQALAQIRALTQQQVLDLLEFYWVAVPFDVEKQLPASYAAQSLWLQKLLTARKYTHDFPQAIGNTQPKSSIDGQLESVIPEALYASNQERHTRDVKELAVTHNKDSLLYDLFRAGPAERLSGIDLLKRRGIYSDDEPHSFLSTSHLAGRRLQPAPYYAIIQADGDSMFELTMQQARGEDGMQKHQQLSQALAAFSQEAQQIVNDHQGCMIYAGGDDILAFMPLHTALHCTQELSRSFATKMQAFQHAGNRPASLSTGLAIVHHLALLLSARAIAKQAVETAKSQDKKNGLSIIIQKRSGEQYRVAGTHQKLTDYLTWLIPYYMTPTVQSRTAAERLTLPKGTAYEIRSTARLIMPRADQKEFLRQAASGKATLGQLGQIMSRDALRILHRKLTFSIPQVPDKEREAACEELLRKFRSRLASEQDGNVIATDTIANLQAQNQAYEQRDGFSTVSSEEFIEEFINELIVAQELAEALEQVGMSREEAIKYMTKEMVQV